MVDDDGNEVDMALEIRYWASRHVNAEYIASTFGESGMPSKAAALRDAEHPSDPMYEIIITVKRVYMDMFCIDCERTPFEIMEYIEYAREEEMGPDEYVWREEGTLNRENGHFTCSHCYVQRGCPSSPTGWKAP